MNAIVRLTRHEADDAQAEALRAVWRIETGNSDIPEIATIAETLPGDPRQAVLRFDELVQHAQVVEAVLPINLLQAVMEHSQFAKSGGIIVRARMERTLNGSGGATFAFVGYERVIRVLVETQAY